MELNILILKAVKKLINIFNEEKYAINILKNGFISNKQGLELFILAKYYRFKHNKDKAECKSLLNQFCNKRIENSEQSDLYKKINSAIKQAYDKNAHFLTIDYIAFSQDELDYINSLSVSPIAKQILFGLWCCNKLNVKAKQSDRWINIAYSELKKFCNLSNSNMLKIMNELYNNDLIFISDRCALCLTFLEDYNNKYNVNMDNVSANTFAETYYIDDFATCGLWWQKYNGNKKIIVCSECGVLTVRGGNRQKYCKDCAKRRELDGKIIYNQMYYQNRKIN